MAVKMSVCVPSTLKRSDANQPLFVVSIKDGLVFTSLLDKTNLRLSPPVPQFFLKLLIVTVTLLPRVEQVENAIKSPK